MTKQVNQWLRLASMAATGVTAVVTTRKAAHPIAIMGLVFLTGVLSYLAQTPRNPNRRDRQTDRQPPPRLLGFQ